MKRYREGGLNRIYFDETVIDIPYTPKYCWQGPSEHDALAPLNRGTSLKMYMRVGLTGLSLVLY